MKMLIRAVLLAGLVILMLGAARGQAPDPQTRSLEAKAANVAGRWSGSFDTVRANGNIEPDHAVFVLTQDGTKLSGMAGPSADHMKAISEGEVSGDTVRFSVPLDQATIQFALHLEGADHMRGEATGLPGLEADAHVKVDVQREAPATAVDSPAAEAAPANGELYATISALDKKLFDAYNTCDLATMSALLEDGLEFYHDQTGLMTGKQPFLAAIKQNICGKTQRTLVSMQVYPLRGYGAVEVGVHRFTHPGQPGINEGEGKFVTIWHDDGGTWRISRAISFDHNNVGSTASTK